MAKANTLITLIPEHTMKDNYEGKLKSLDEPPTPWHVAGL